MTRKMTEHLLCHKNPLRPTKAPEGGIGGQMGSRDAAIHLQCGEVIGVVDMDHGARQHGRRQVATPASIGDQLDARATQLTIGIGSQFVARQKRVPLASQLHIQ